MLLKIAKNRNRRDKLSDQDKSRRQRNNTGFQSFAETREESVIFIEH